MVNLYTFPLMDILLPDVLAYSPFNEADPSGLDMYTFPLMYIVFQKELVHTVHLL